MQSDLKGVFSGYWDWCQVFEILAAVAVIHYDATDARSENMV